MCLRRLLCLLIFPLFLSSGLAQESETTRQLDREISRYQQLVEERQQEQARIREALGDTAALLQTRLDERDRISNELSDLRQTRTALLGEIADLELQLEATRANIVAEQQKLEGLKEKLQILLLSLYKQRGGRYTRILSQAESFYELRVKNYYLSLIAEQDVQLLEELDLTVQTLAQEQAELTAKVAERNAKEQELRSNQERLEASQAELTQIIAELESTQQGQLAMRNALIEEQQELEQSIAEFVQAREQEIARLKREAEEARRRAAQAAVEARERQRLLEQARQADEAVTALIAPTGDANADLALPFPKPRLLSSYGEEGAYILLRAEQPGVAVRASESGRVYLVSNLGANSGYLVAIQHSPQLITAYVNLQRPQLQIGSLIKKGEVIGYLGGGTLFNSDTLRFYVGIPQTGESPKWVDPLPFLGLVE